MGLNEATHKPNVDITLNQEENTLNERLTDIDDDVNMLYDIYFKDAVDEFDKTKKVTTELFKKRKADTSILKSEESVKAHELNPCVIGVNEGGNYYDPNNNYISISANLNAANFILKNDGDLARTQSMMDPEEAVKIAKEFTEERIKGSIHHELVHWIDDTMNKGHIKRLLDKRVAQSSAGEPVKYGKKEINAHYMERQAQIHNIKQLHNKYESTWDTLSFKDMIDLSPALMHIYASLPYDLKMKWVKDIKMRMFREGLLGKKMFN